MKLFRFGLVSAVILLIGTYLWIVGPQPTAHATIYPSSIVNTDDQMITIHPIESVGQHNSSYQVDFQLKSNTGSTIQATVTTYNFFCPNLSGDGKCYSFGTTKSRPITVPADHYIDAWSDLATPAMAHVSGYRDCGLYQIDLHLSYPGANNSENYQAAGGFSTGRICTVVTPTATPTPTPQFHFACQNNECVKVSGSGKDSCTTQPNSCIQQNHSICQNNACKVVAGPGTSTCSNDADCQVQHHNICQNFACVQVVGGGTSTCDTPADNSSECSHLTCQNNECIRVVGGGSDSCSTDSNCQTQTHHACVSNSCQVVNGAGSDSCTQDSDCQTNTCTGDNCGTTINITNNNTNTQSQQQQQQQEVLAASVAPAVSTTQLPSTGAGAEVLLTLAGLLPVGFKLRKLV